MRMRLNRAKDMSINVAIACLYSSMTFTATNKKGKKKQKNNDDHAMTRVYRVSSLLYTYIYIMVHMPIEILCRVGECWLSICVIVVAFRLHHNFV